MTSALLNPPRLVLADLLPGTIARDAALVLAGAGLTGIAAQVAVHTSLTPVPFTLQTLAVLVTGAALGSVRGMLSMVLYLVAGGLGVPWFAAHTQGWGGPSFGYLLGFVVAASVVGELARRGKDRDVLTTVGLMALGTAIVYVIGTIWLSRNLGVSGSRAISLGVTPFLIGDAVKVALAAVALPTAWKLVGK
jgi:biotin transport system substrate-specific component